MHPSERALLTLSTGLYAGLGTSLTLVSVPAILASKDPLPSWRTTYSNGSKIALSSLITSTAVGIRCYLKTDDWRYLLVSGLAFVVMPYTVLFMKGTNDALFAIKDTERDENDGKVRKLIGKWNKMQYARTFLGVSAFFVNVLILHKRL